MRRDKAITLADFIDGFEYGPASTVLMTLRRGTYKAETHHADAADAVVRRANHYGLDHVRTLTDDGRHVVTVKGFSKA